MSLARHTSGESQTKSLSLQQILTIKGSHALYAVAVGLLAAIYFVAAKFGLSLASVHTNVSPVWPSTGIALAAVLLLGLRVWPGIFLGAFLVNLMTPVTPATAFGIAIGNTLEAVIAASALNALGFRKSLDRARDIFKFVSALLVCTMISATIGNVSLCLGHAAAWSGFGSLWMTWWLGDLTGGVTVAPLILTWAVGAGHWLPKRRYLEATALIVLLSVSAIVTFGGASPASVHYYPLSRLMVPFLLWAAFRLGRRGVTVAIAVVSAFAIWGTSHGAGPFISNTPNESLLLLQVFIATNAVTFLFLVTVVEEKRLAEARRREDQRRVEANLAVTRILAESPEVSIAMERILATVGETLGWEFGCAWMPDANRNVLRNVAIWQRASKAPRFEAACRERSFDLGTGLPGRVWTSLRPEWIRDVTKDDNFPRAPIAAAEGLHGAFAFPIMFNEKFLGLMEFFSSEIRQPDEVLLAMFTGIGSQIGQFMERKRAESAVESASLLPKENPSPVIRMTGEGVVSYANPAAQRLLDVWQSAVGEAAPEHIAEKARDVFASGARESTELSVGNRNYSVDFAPIIAADYVNLYFNDITDRKRAERTMRHFGAIVESTDDAVISKNLNGIIASWNPAAERLYGYKAEEVIGKPVTILIPRERPDEEPAILARLRRGERIDHYETIRVAKDGRRLDVSLTVSPIHDVDGTIIGASKIARDITQQKQAQNEIARLLAAERAARQDAEVASRTKDEFLATLSHELRTPLTAMLGWLTILRAHKLDKKTTEHAIETVERNAKVQAQLIEDLVDISRIVGGKLNLEVGPMELLPVINAAVEVVRPAADAKEISIDVNYDATVGPVSGDAGRMQQIIWNLLSNAVKFTPKGGSVFVNFRRIDTFAELVVRDTGIGISEDFLPHVFERFRQAESSATRSHRGMGLGLAIVRHLIELHGGTVSATSDGKNRGATFTIHLPLATVAKVTAASVLQRTNGDNRQELTGLRILLVEDEPDARELILMILQDSGADVEAVDSVRDALQRLPLFVPHVLVSDIGLPRESGYDLIREVRSLASDINTVPAIALTAFATENDRKMSLSAGFQVHLAKPVEPADLLKAIKGVVNGNH